MPCWAPKTKPKTTRIKTSQAINQAYRKTAPSGISSTSSSLSLRRRTPRYPEAVIELVADIKAKAHLRHHEAISTQTSNKWSLSLVRTSHTMIEIHRRDNQTRTCKMCWSNSSRNGRRRWRWAAWQLHNLTIKWMRCLVQTLNKARMRYSNKSWKSCSKVRIPSWAQEGSQRSQDRAELASKPSLPFLSSHSQ